MIREFARLSAGTFDAIVVGGGVYGLAAAWELASRGIRIAIVERGDFAAGTSFNSLKTVHGGIRALQHGALGEMREFIRERRAIATIAPHLVRPMPFVVPTYRHPVRNRMAMGVFFAAYDRLSADRNAGVDPSRALPPSFTVGRDESLHLNPAIDAAGVTGGAVWHDYQMHSPDRFAMALLQSSAAAGACAVNYAEVRAILVRGREVLGVRVHDRQSGDETDVRARVVVNAAGPGAWPLLERSGLLPRSIAAPRFSLAMNLVVSRAPLPRAVGGMAGGRFVFMVPWRDRSIIGTSHDEIPGPASEGEAFPVDRRAAEAFLAEASAAFPRVALDLAAVRLVHRGLLPAGRGPGTLLKRSIVHDHTPDGLDGLVTVVGVRYTTARATAAAAGAHAARLLGRPAGRSVTATLPLTGGDMRNVAEYEQEQARVSPLRPEVVKRLIAAYGTGYGAVARLITADAALGRPLSAECDVTRAEVLHAVREEMALHLTDALLRRTSAGAGGHPGATAVSAAADVMAAALEWAPARVAQEIAAVDDFYAMPH